MPKKNKILFVCHGNICRSVMAQWIMQDLIEKNQLSDRFEVDSAAVSSEEKGHPMYFLAQEKLVEKKIPFGNHKARKITPQDYIQFDEIYLMDHSNQYWINRILSKDKENKIHLLLENEEISDPWYSGDFETAFQQIQAGCLKRLEELSGQPINKNRKS